MRTWAAAWILICLCASSASAEPRRVRFDSDGPWLELRHSGDLGYSGPDFEAVIRPDGSVEFAYHLRIDFSPYTGLTIEPRLRRPTAEQRFRDATFELRFELKMRAQRDNLERALGGLRGRLERRWADPTLTQAEKRHWLFELWNEAAEPEDRELAAAGARARDIIERFVRDAGVAYSPEELARLQSERRRAPAFDPYGPPRPSVPIASVAWERAAAPAGTAAVAEAPAPARRAEPAQAPLPSASLGSPRRAAVVLDPIRLRPLVRASIGGRSAWLLLDTGASMHLASPELLSTGARVGRDVPSADFEGRALAMRSMERPAGLRIPGWGEPEGDWVVGPDAYFRREDVEGILLPQWLPAAGRAVVIDFRVGTMTEMPWDDATRALAGAGRALVDAPMGEDRKFSASALVRGRAMRLAIDTGAQRTTLFAARQRTAGLPPGASAYQTVPRVTVRVGEVRATTTLGLMERAQDWQLPFDGVLGMDVLRHCVLAMDRTRLVARCD